MELDESDQEAFRALVQIGARVAHLSVIFGIPEETIRQIAKELKVIICD